MKGKMRAIAMGLACSAGVMSAVPAGAQVVIMRKMMPFKGSAQPVVENPNAPTVPTDPDAVKYYSWVVSPWVQEGVCGSQGVQNRDVACRRTDGTVVPDSRCLGNGSGPKPISMQAVEVTQTCGYQWDAGPWSDPGATCGKEDQTRDVVCRRSDGKVAADAACGSGKPATGQTVDDFSACTYSWRAGVWSPPTNQCGASTQTREVTCQRSNGDEVPEAMCASAGTRPPMEQEAYVTTGCAANWKEGDWNKPAPACGMSVRTRDVTCMRADGVQVSEDQCILEKPAGSEQVKDYSTCIDGRTPENPWGWTVGEFGAPSTTCGMATRTRSVVCTDDDGGAVPDERCLLTKPEATQESEETSGCSFEWKVGEFSAVVPACGNTAQTRTVVCTRTDGKAMADSNCTTPKPSNTQPYADYSACTFGWSQGSYGAWSTTCGPATRTRTVACQRSDGTTAPEENCTGQKPGDSESAYQTGGCSFEWQAGAWQTPQACGDVTQTRVVECVRSDGEAIDEASCLAAFPAKPISSQATKDYTTCSYSWSVGNYGGWSTTCGSATSNRSVTCQRSDGTAVSDSMCVSAGQKPETQQTADFSTGCTYSWKAGTWGDAAPACGASTMSRTVDCVRSDSSATVVAPSFCTGAKPATQQAATSYSTCSYDWEVSNWSSENLCGQSAIQTRTVTCRRSDGGTDIDGSCVVNGAGPKPASSQTVSTYAGCGYSWNVRPGEWSSTCSDTATRINTVQCLRSDGQAVDDSMCAGEVPARQETKGIYSTCTYTPTYAAEYGECKPNTPTATTGIHTAPIVSCMRSDGTTVANSSCNPQFQSQSCSLSNSNARYIREPRSLYSTNSYSDASVFNRTQNDGTFKFYVRTTTCYDTTTKGIVNNSNCTALAEGANIGDVISVPATYVADLREIWVNQADLMSIAPNGMFLSGNYSAAQMCSRGMALVNSAGANETWTMRCGAPDNAGHYERVASNLHDPYSVLPNSTDRFLNSSEFATSLKLAVGSVRCYDAISKVTATGKCDYIAGANVYDIVTIPAVFSKELREIWVDKANINSILSYGGSLGAASSGYSVDNRCTNGLSIRVGTATSSNSWTMYCGAAPDTADHYVRTPSSLEDPLTALPESNPLRRVNTGGNTLRMAVYGTLCYDTFTNKSAPSAKCSYLSTGPNTYDMVQFPATYVKGLREVYVDDNEVRAAIPYGSQINGFSKAGFCGRSSIYVYPNGASGTGERWSLMCGTPDSADNYKSFPWGLVDPYSVTSTAGINRERNISPSASTLTLVIDNTTCRVLATGAGATKCSYLEGGIVRYDPVTIPAVYSEGLRQVFITQEDINKALPYGGEIFGYNASSVCQTRYSPGVYVGTEGNRVRYDIICGAPDTADHYLRYITSYRDPWGYFRDEASKTVNDTRKPAISFVVDGVGCYDTTANANGGAKCNYIPGVQTYDLRSVPATWDAVAKTVTFKKSDVEALSPQGGANAVNATCNKSFYVGFGASGSYRTVCQ